MTSLFGANKRFWVSCLCACLASCVVLADVLEEPDPAVVAENVAALESLFVADPAALQARYRDEQTMLLPILLPLLPFDPDLSVIQNAGLVVCDPSAFPWLSSLLPSELHGVTVYPVIVTEDRASRDTLFLDAEGNEADSVEAEQGYDPFIWVENTYPDMFLETLSDAEIADILSLNDPARIRICFYLLSSNDVADMAEAMAIEAEEYEPAFQDSEQLDETPTNIVIFAIETATNAVSLGIAWPEEFTNRLEVFSRNTLAPLGWTVISTNLCTDNAPALWWTDYSVTTNDNQKFYRVGDAQQDSDSDGLTDARERLTWGSSEASVDTDADGLGDYAEAISMRTDPTNGDTNKPFVTFLFPQNNEEWVYIP